MVATLVASLAVLRGNLEAMLNREPEVRYETVPVEQFQNLSFSANWSVKIKQGREYKVELAVDDMAAGKPRLQTNEGTLYLETDSAGGSQIRAKVTVPYLQAIWAGQGTTILLESFKSDTINLHLEEGSDFTGKSNKFNYISLKTVGDVSFQLTTAFDE